MTPLNQAAEALAAIELAAFKSDSNYSEEWALDEIYIRAFLAGAKWAMACPEFQRVLDTWNALSENKLLRDHYAALAALEKLMAEVEK